MPGGRGEVISIATSLNSENHSEVVDSIKCAIDGGYRISNVTVPQIGAAFSLCENPADLTDIWSYASAKGAVDWLDY